MRSFEEKRAMVWALTLAMREVDIRTENYVQTVEHYRGGRLGAEVVTKAAHNVLWADEQRRQINRLTEEMYR